MHMSKYDRTMDNAHQDGRELLLLVPTGDPDAPLTQEVGWWDEELDRWEGDWRYYDGDGGYADREPIAWADLPAIDQEYYDQIKISSVPKRKPKAAINAAKAKATAVKPKPADRRSVQGKKNVDMTKGKPVAAPKPASMVSNTDHDPFDGP
jgi:hypothetical protein